MSKLTVKEYATINQVSVQSVYKHIKNGTLDVHTINNTKYIIIQDKLDYEKKFNDLQLKYDLLKERFDDQKELISILKEDRNIYRGLIEYKKEVEQLTTKKEKKKKKKNKKKDK